ncbi:hypothetical protein [Nocardia sp. NRRL S-836]|uniref:hypothetical protein n=1 Tax=Nocardia sp. NRRL S-836 TaxID=1519492 RepID=UPI0006AF2AD3|nr:hypothetical protein [Nocardia sp. NRRL S-836]KOV85377.1 hypothetical protein ADL03_14780 [Nocardia sp. NRRL S-836]
MAAFRTALDQGSELRPVYDWFLDNAPGGSKSISSIVGATHDAEHGDLAGARGHLADVDAEVAEDQRKLAEDGAASWRRATPRLLVETPLAAAAIALPLHRRAANAEAVATRYTPRRPVWRRPVFLLVSGLRALGPVIAVGRPGERLPRLGAARFYLPDDDWKSGVRELMGLCRLIVLRLGPGTGLWWEVEEARTTQPPGKLVLLMPGDCADPGEEKALASPAYHVTRALQSALRRVGITNHGMTTRTNIGVLASFGKVVPLLSAAVLALHVLRLFVDR